MTSQQDNISALLQGMKSSVSAFEQTKDRALLQQIDSDFQRFAQRRAELVKSAQYRIPAVAYYYARIALNAKWLAWLCLVTIGAGVATFVVGPVTGAALGASSEVIAISIAAGVVKSVLVMVVTPFVAKPLGINNPQSAMAFGGIMGTTSGTAAGMAAVNPKLVPYAAMTATFYTGLGCLLFPSVFYFMTRMVF